MKYRRLVLAPETGTGVFAGDCIVHVSEPIPAVENMPGYAWREVDERVSYETHYVLNGVITAYTQAERDRMRERPRRSEWSAETRQWVDKSTLADAKLDKLGEMKRACDAEIDANFVTGQGTFAADRDARQEYVSLMVTSMRLNQLGQNSNVVIEKTNGVPVSATLAEISQLVIAIHNRTQAAYVKLRTVKQQIDAATTVAQVQAITWP